MSESENPTETAASEPRGLDVDGLEREPTGDPHIDRGLDLTIDELEKAIAKALLGVSERMSEMVRVSAEHRDVALQ